MSMPSSLQEILNSFSAYPPWMVYTGLGLVAVMLIYLACKVLKFVIYTSIVMLIIGAVGYGLWMLFYR